MPSRFALPALLRRGLGLRRQGQAAPPFDHLPYRPMVLAGIVLGLVLGLPLALALHHPWALPLWLLLVGALLFLARDVEPVVEDLGLAPPAARAPAPASKRPPRPRLVDDGLLTMVALPGGTFLMGSPETDDQAYDDERPQHPVTVSPFLIGQTPVTRGLWRAVMGEGLAEWREPDDDRLPANYVKWEDAVRFCNALSKRQGRRRCYRQAGLGSRRRWVCDWRADGYRLPTEAEWEYACRAGTTTRWFFGDDARSIGEYAWYSKTSDSEVHPVGDKRPNPWLLHDMIGNVWEWCWDRYAPYPSEPSTDPRGPVDGSWRVLRGGSFFVPPRRLRSARRDGDGPGLRSVYAGLRCVRVPARQP